MKLPLYERQLRDVERNTENLLDAIRQGIFTKSTKDRLDEPEAAKEKLEIRIAKEKIAKPKLTEEKIKHFLYRFRASQSRGCACPLGRPEASSLKNAKKLS